MFDQVLSGFEIPKNYYTKSNQVTLIFKSDSTGVNGVFYLAYEALERGLYFITCRLEIPIH